MNRYLYFAVFASGLTTLALELSAARLLGVAFGTSNVVWASIIGLILIYLTAGYFLGGRWADRSPHAETMYSIMAWAAFTAGLIPAIARPVLRLAAGAFDQLQVGILFGSFTAVLILFSVPVTLLGTTSPFAIRLAIQDARHAGEISGRIYAVSTLGSFVGTFLPVLVFIPLLGTTYTILAFSAFLLAVALVGLGISAGWRKVLRYAWMPLVLAVLAVMLSGRALKTTTGQIFETESAYNYIEVLETDGYRFLRLNEGQGVHSQWHPTELDYHGPWEQFHAAPFFNEPEFRPEQVERIAIVGLAAGTTARQASQVFGAVPIDGYEIDPEIIEVGQQFFEMTMPNLNAIAQDGRLGLERSPHKYSLVVVDAYRPPYIPWHLTTREFFQVVHDHLDEQGVMAINVGRAPQDRRLVDALASTISTVFPSVYVMDIPNTFNSIIYATAQPTEKVNLYNNLLSLYSRADVHPLLLASIERTLTNLQPIPTTGQIFTDDRAPIEWLTNNMVLSFVLFGDMSGLQGESEP